MHIAQLRLALRFAAVIAHHLDVVVFAAVWFRPIVTKAMRLVSAPEKLPDILYFSPVTDTPPGVGGVVPTGPVAYRR